jgi:hypothetical protein
MGPKGRPDTQTNWSTVCRPQEELRKQTEMEIHPNSFPFLKNDANTAILAAPLLAT